MNQKIFRQTSMDRISSPEQLNDYIRVSNPGVWIILGTILLLLAGVCVWGIFGRLETVSEAWGVVSGERAVCYVADQSELYVGGKVRIKDQEGEITAISAAPENYNSIAETLKDEYVLYASGAVEGCWMYRVTVDIPGIQDGYYDMELVVDSVSPISFILN